MTFQKGQFPMKSAGDVGPSPRTTPTGRNPVDAHDNVTHLDEVRRIDTPVARIDPAVLEEFGISRLSQLAGHTEEARREFMEGLKLVDRSEDRDLHVRVGFIVNAIDDFRQYMAARNGEDQS